MYRLCSSAPDLFAVCYSHPVATECRTRLSNEHKVGGLPPPKAQWKVKKWNGEYLAAFERQSNFPLWFPFKHSPFVVSVNSSRNSVATLGSAPNMLHYAPRSLPPIALCWPFWRRFRLSRESVGNCGGFTVVFYIISLTKSKKFLSPVFVDKKDTRGQWLWWTPAILFIPLKMYIHRQWRSKTT